LKTWLKRQSTTYKCKTLSSNPSTTKKKEERGGGGREPKFLEMEYMIDPQTTRQNAHLRRWTE
jgi:hypothetical protein